MPLHHHLRHVPVLRMPITQLPLLFLGQAFQPMITLALRPGFVLPQHVYDAEGGEHDNAHLGAQVDCMTDGIAWRVGEEVRPSAKMSATHERTVLPMKEAYVATIAPRLPMLTMYAEVTDRMAGPAALLSPQLRNPGPAEPALEALRCDYLERIDLPPGKAPQALKKTAMYFSPAESLTLRMVNPITQSNGKVAR